MEDLAVTAMTRVMEEVLRGKYDKTEIALDFGEAEEFLAKLLIESAQDVQYDANTGRLMVVFERESLKRY